MNRTSNDPSTPVTRAERVFALAGLAVALVATPVLALVSAPAPVVAFVWTLAILWTVFANLGHALRLGLARGDWSRFGTGCEAQERARHDTLDWSTRTGAYAYRRIRARDEAAMRDSPPFDD